MKKKKVCSTCEDKDELIQKQLSELKELRAGKEKYGRFLSSLSEMWSSQKEFNRNFVPFGELTDADRQRWSKQYVLEMMSEMAELLDEINFKEHRPVKPVIKSNLLEQWIDVFKYWLSLGLIWDWTPDDFTDMFHWKSLVVELRHKQEMLMNLPEETKVIGVDIDGVLADYPTHFQRFIYRKTGKIKIIKSYNLYDEYAELLGREEMEQLKHEFRESGEKQNIGVIDGAVEFLQVMHDAGFKIVLLTSRPYKKYKRIFTDTLYWLTKNNLHYDAVIWDEEKDYKAVKQFPHMKFMIEDRPDFAINIAKLGYRVYVPVRPYNFEMPYNPNITKFVEFKEIVKKEL